MPTLHHPWGSLWPHVSWIPPPPSLEKFIVKLDTVSLGRLQDGCQEPRTFNCHLLEPSLTLVNLGSNKTNLGKFQWILIKYYRLLVNLPRILSSCNNSDITIGSQYSWAKHNNCQNDYNHGHHKLHDLHFRQFSKINSERQVLYNPGFIEPWSWTLWSTSEPWLWAGKVQHDLTEGERIKSFNLWW